MNRKSSWGRRIPLNVNRKGKADEKRWAADTASRFLLEILQGALSIALMSVALLPYHKLNHKVAGGTLGNVGVQSMERRHPHYYIWWRKPPVLLQLIYQLRRTMLPRLEAKNLDKHKKSFDASEVLYPDFGPLLMHPSNSREASQISSKNTSCIPPINRNVFRIPRWCSTSELGPRKVIQMAISSCHSLRPAFKS